MSAVTPEIERAVKAIRDAQAEFSMAGTHTIARAALASLLPPSPAMVEAAVEATFRAARKDSAVRYREAWREHMTAALTAAIRAAIGEKP